MFGAAALRLDRMVKTGALKLQPSRALLRSVGPVQDEYVFSCCSCNAIWEHSACTWCLRGNLKSRAMRCQEAEGEALLQEDMAEAT